MNLNNFTIKAQEVVQHAAEASLASGRQEIQTGHLLDALLETDENSVPFLLKKLSVNIDLLKVKIKD
jgi:ATP-dependent Clp protease ATP-binding subunit ClpB